MSLLHYLSHNIKIVRRSPESKPSVFITVELFHVIAATMRKKRKSKKVPHLPENAVTRICHCCLQRTWYSISGDTLIKIVVKEKLQQGDKCGLTLRFVDLVVSFPAHLCSGKNESVRMEWSNLQLKVNQTTRATLYVRARFSDARLICRNLGALLISCCIAQKETTKP